MPLIFRLIPGCNDHVVILTVALSLPFAVVKWTAHLSVKKYCEAIKSKKERKCIFYSWISQYTLDRKKNMLILTLMYTFKVKRKKNIQTQNPLSILCLAHLLDGSCSSIYLFSEENTNKLGACT